MPHRNSCVSGDPKLRTSLLAVAATPYGYVYRIKNPCHFGSSNPIPRMHPLGLSLRRNNQAGAGSERQRTKKSLDVGILCITALETGKDRQSHQSSQQDTGVE